MTVSMTLAQFRLSFYDTECLGDSLGDETLEGVSGRIYLVGDVKLYVEFFHNAACPDAAPFCFLLTLERDTYTGCSLAPLEVHLYEYAVACGYIVEPFDVMASFARAAFAQLAA